jgi:hypothetical protein
LLREFVSTGTGLIAGNVDGLRSAINVGVSKRVILTRGRAHFFDDKLLQRAKGLPISRMPEKR